VVFKENRMAKQISIVLAVSLFFCLFSLQAGETKSSLVGTWEGTMDIPGAAGPAEVVMKIQEINGKYELKIWNSMGMTEVWKCENIEMSSDGLKYYCCIPDGSGFLTQIYVHLEIAGNKMSGHWEDDNGTYANIVLKKKQLLAP